MNLALYNSLSRKKQVFEPADPKRVTMYNCGPTVYSYAHIGNARAAVAADVLFRVLRSIYGADHVVYARNITDVDDKINIAANEQGVDISVITERFSKIYNDDLAALGCLMPNMQPKATAHMGEMVAMIQVLLAAGHAYEADGHVLFDVASYEDYGQLSGRALGDNLAGARVKVADYKRSPEDFVLWKPSKVGEPEWPAPFGNGRPGWHLECSAMIEKNLGTSIDIHCGGQDLKFPHHENEIAQSVCAHKGAPLANYWVHNGFLQMDSTKMSKSLGNVKLVHELLKTWDGEVLRFALLSGHYRSELDWTDDLLKQSKATLDGWYRVIGAGEGQIDPGFMAALLDDVNTPESFGHLSALAHKGDGLSLKACANLLGLLKNDPDDWFRGKGKEGGLSDVEIEALIKERAEVRAAKNWSRADEIRDIFKTENIILEDGKDGTTWRRG